MSGIDFLVPLGGARLALIEAKASATPAPEMAALLVSLARSVKGREVRSFVIHRRAREGARKETLRPGVRALAVESLRLALQ